MTKFYISFFLFATLSFGLSIALWNAQERTQACNALYLYHLQEDERISKEIANQKIDMMHERLRRDFKKLKLDDDFEEQKNLMEQKDFMEREIKKQQASKINP